MSTYTPGPWHTGDGIQCLVIYDQHGWAVADAKVRHSRRTLDESHANARLLACAPELLEACLAMVEWDDREKDHAVSFEERIALCELAFEKARSAITKALGTA